MNFVCIVANDLNDMAAKLNSYFETNKNGKLLIGPIAVKTWYEALVQS